VGASDGGPSPAAEGRSEVDPKPTIPSSGEARVLGFGPFAFINALKNVRYVMVTACAAERAAQVLARYRFGPRYVELAVALSVAAKDFNEL
jgi:hypothetical protein